MNIALYVLLIFVGIVVGYLIEQFISLRKLDSTQRKIKENLEKARDEARNLILSAKDKAASIIEQAQKEERERKNELRKLENRLLTKEETLEKEESILRQKRESLNEEIKKIEEKEEDLKKIEEEKIKELGKITKLSPEEAKEELFDQLSSAHKEEIFSLLKKYEREKRESLEKKGLEIISSSLQRLARATVSELTTTLVNLPNEEIKGKIIGREGRNIRAIEHLTGVDIIVDETPQTVTISSFDPVRREVAKLTLEKLIRDGRIQPARIEEKYEEAKEEIKQRVKEIGENAAYEAGVLDLPSGILSLLGKLHFRTSYGQNVLHHSVEVALLSEALASELHLDSEAAKKAGLLHDIGKAVSEETGGSHVEIGRKILKKYGIEEKIIKAMEAHHEDYPFAIPEAYIIATADILSTARPGARRDTLENYLKRIKELEEIAKNFNGVKEAYVISGGRELRVFVIPEKLDDFGALSLAKNIATKIQSESSYPGEIKVNVIREIRAVEYAK